MKETETACKDLGIRDWSQAAEFVLKHNIDKRQFVHEELARKGGTLKACGTFIMKLNAFGRKDLPICSSSSLVS